ncbi:helix-turn-helix domain-containing protein [Pseudactinotalea sp. Z1748]|uniref:helix-turn-helix domain-containing protein n=1 Tax=Pseudactinotalea sp. Z1748 TaxID=3413027 RepID=UPI003C7B4F4F
MITNDYGRFAQIPLVLAFDPLISPNAVKLYTILWGYSSAGDRQAFPSRETIAKHMGRSTDTVDRGLKELVAYQAVAIEHAFDGGRQVANVYRILNLAVSRPDLFDPGSANASATDERPAAAPGQEPSQTSATGQETPDGAGPDAGEHRSPGASGGPAARGAAPVRPRGRNPAPHGGRTGAEGIYEQEPEEQESSSSVLASPQGAGESLPTRTEDDPSSPSEVDHRPASALRSSPNSAASGPGSPGGQSGAGELVAGGLEARLRAAGIEPARVDLGAAKDEVLGARMGHRIGNRTAYVAAAIIREPWRWPPEPAGDAVLGARAVARDSGGSGDQEPIPGGGSMVVRKRVAMVCPRCGHEWLWWEPRTGVHQCPDCKHLEDPHQPDHTSARRPGQVA